MSQKRGQLSVFVIVGLVIVILGSLGAYLYSSAGEGATPEGQLRGDDPLSQMQGIMEDCVRAQSVPLLQRISLGGGTFNPNRLWKGQKYNILCVDTGITGCVNTLKTKKDIADEFNTAFAPLLTACLDFRPLEKMGFTVEKGMLQTNTIVGFDDVTISLKMPITLTRGAEKISYGEQVVIVDSPLGQLHSLANVMLNQHVRSGFVDKDALMVAYGDRFHIEMDRPYPDVLFTISTKDRNERPYSFLFGEKGTPTAKTVSLPRPAPRLQQNCLVNFDCFDNVPEALCIAKGGAAVPPADARCKPPFIEQPECKDGACKPCDVGGKEVQHGTAWCDSTAKRENGLDPVGSRFMKLSCVDGAVLVEPCRDFREEFCTVQNTTAACRINRWFDCWNVQDQATCEDTSKRDCFWTDTLIPKTSDRPTSRCRPYVAPGLAHWIGTKTATKNICQLGNEMWHEDLGVFSQAVSWKPYVPHATGEARFCQAMGDCGNKVGMSDVPADKRFKSRESGKPPQSTYFPSKDEMLNLPLNTSGFAGITPQTFYYPTGDTKYMQSRTDAYINWLISNAIPILLDSLPIYALHSNFCKNWMPRKALQDCPLCETSAAGCSEYLCRSLGRRCVFTTDIGGYPHCRLPGDGPPMKVELEFPGHSGVKTITGYRVDAMSPYETLTVRVLADRPTICITTLFPGIDGVPESDDPEVDGDLAIVRLLIGSILGKSFDPEIADYMDPTTDQSVDIQVPDLTFLGRFDDKPMLLSFAANPADLTTAFNDAFGVFEDDPVLSSKIQPALDRIDGVAEKFKEAMQSDPGLTGLSNKVELLLSVDGLRREPRVLRVYVRCDDETGEADSVQIPVEIPITKDLKPPVILNVTPPAGGLTPSSLRLLLNEPSQCGYSLDVDKKQEDMSPMQCEIYQIGSRTCDANLIDKGVKHTVYVRCKDRPYAFIHGSIVIQPGPTSVTGGLVYSSDPLNVTIMPLVRQVSLTVPPKAGGIQATFNFADKYLCKYSTENVSYERMAQTMTCNDRHCSAPLDTTNPGVINFICADGYAPYQNEMPQPYVINYDNSQPELTENKNVTMALTSPEDLLVDATNGTTVTTTIS